MQRDGFNKSLYHWLTTSALISGLSLKIKNHFTYRENWVFFISQNPTFACCSLDIKIQTFFETNIKPLLEKLLICIIELLSLVLALVSPTYCAWEQTHANRPDCWLKLPVGLISWYTWRCCLSCCWHYPKSGCSDSALCLSASSRCFYMPS